MEDEIRLLQRCASGEEGAYAELVARFEVSLVNYIHRLVGNRTAAEDLFQETFVRVVSSIGRFNPRCRLSTWLFTIAHNLCVDFLRKASRARLVSIDAFTERSSGRTAGLLDDSSLADDRDPVRHSAEKRETQELILSSLRELAPAKREALILRVYEGLSYEEIAEITNAKVNTLKFRVHDAIRELGKKLRGLENDSSRQAAV